MKHRTDNDLNDCILALLLGMGLQTALLIAAAWNLYKDCQP